MKNKFIIYHNPRWGKSRKSVQILKDNNLDFSIIEYLKNPLKRIELKEISKKLNLNPSQFIRKNEKIFKELNVKEHERMKS